MKLTKLEQETIITFNEQESFAEVYTHNVAMIKKLNKLCEKFPDRFKLTTFEYGSGFYKIPKKYIRISTPGKTPVNGFIAQNSTTNAVDI